MSDKIERKEPSLRSVLACLGMILLVLVPAVPAFADDEELLELIPGTWTATDEVMAEGEEPQEVTG